MNPHLSSPRSNRSTASNWMAAASIADQKRASSPPNVANALERNDVAAGDADGNAWSGKLVTDPASGAKISSKGTLPQILTNNKALSAAWSRCSSCEIRYLRPQNSDDLSKHV
jgi:hypothetical protein